MRIWRVPALTMLALTMLVTGCLPTPSGSSPRAPVDVSAAGDCRLPVDAPVIDGFRPPTEPWLAGNRGLTFDTVAGASVRSVGAGTVTFAGEIAHHRYVTIRRGDGADVTYSYLDATRLAVGDSVTVGDPVGVTGSEPFHLGHRRDGVYLDPGPLLTAACGPTRAILVPLPD